MSNFDISRDQYRELHDISLPLGLNHNHFRAQKTSWVVETILRQAPRTFLDFGFGPGELLEDILRVVGPEKLLLSGVEPSHVLREEFITRNKEASLAHRIHPSLDAVGDGSIELITCFNVLHHIPPDARLSAAESLMRKLAPGGSLLVWEHNPYNPGTQLLVCRCPYDDDAVLLTRQETIRLFASLTPTESKYVNLVPPQVGHWSIFKKIESCLSQAPIGAQYRINFRRGQ